MRHPASPGERYPSRDGFDTHIQLANGFGAAIDVKRDLLFAGEFEQIAMLFRTFELSLAIIIGRRGLQEDPVIIDRQV